MLVKVAHYASSMAFFSEIMPKLCSFVQMMLLLLKLCSLKKLEISPKIQVLISAPLSERLEQAMVYKKETPRIPQ